MLVTECELVSRLSRVNDLLPTVIVPNSLTEHEARAVYRLLPTVRNSHDSREVRFVNATFGKLIGHKGVDAKQIIPYLPSLFAGSILIYSEEQQRIAGHKWHNNLKCYHNYLTKISLCKRDYFVRLTVQEPVAGRRGKPTDELHSTFISAIWTKNPASSSVSSQDSLQGDRSQTGRVVSSFVSSSIVSNGDRSQTDIVDAKLRHFFECARVAEQKSIHRL
jgi:hypothetical protein